MKKQIVHYCCYSSQPDIQIACDESWDTPKIPTPAGLPPNVYMLMDGRLYTFEKKLNDSYYKFMMCEDCVEYIGKRSNG